MANDEKAMVSFEPRGFEELMVQCKVIAASTLIPRALQGKPADLAIITMTGRELGLGAMTSLRGLHVIEGKAVMSAELMAGLVQSNRSTCSWFRMVESTDKIATYETLRVGHPAPTKMSFTIEQATKAGLTGKNNWRTHPAAMLRARCAAALARAVYPDLVLGVYDPDEAQEFSRPATTETSGYVQETRQPVNVPRHLSSSSQDIDFKRVDATAQALTLLDAVQQCTSMEVLDQLREQAQKLEHADRAILHSAISTRHLQIDPLPSMNEIFDGDDLPPEMGGEPKPPKRGRASKKAPPADLAPPAEQRAREPGDDDEEVPGLRSTSEIVSHLMDVLACVTTPSELASWAKEVAASPEEIKVMMRAHYKDKERELGCQ